MTRHDDHSQPTDRRNYVGSGNDAFDCAICGSTVLPLEGGGFRNHCPHCLWSRHVDRVPGDRAECCNGLMEPVGLEGSSARGWSVVHRCQACGFERRNRAALDDPRQPDSWDQLMELSTSARDS